MDLLGTIAVIRRAGVVAGCGLWVACAPASGGMTRVDGGSSIEQDAGVDAPLALDADVLDGAMEVDAGVDVTPAFADTVVEAKMTDGPFGDPDRAVNGVRGAGAALGSFDVFSLGYEPDNNAMVLRWSDRAIADGPGADFVVFENAFEVAPAVHFMDLVIVEVSHDGIEWAAFPHDYRASTETTYSSDPATWSGFAGRTPTLFHAEDNPVDPFSLPRAGGDAFDLADLDASDPVAEKVLRSGMVFVRLTSAASVLNPDTGELYPRAAISDGPDIDGVAGRHLIPNPSGA